MSKDIRSIKSDEKNFKNRANHMEAVEKKLERHDKDHNTAIESLEHKFLQDQHDSWKERHWDEEVHIEQPKLHIRSPVEDGFNPFAMLD